MPKRAVELDLADGTWRSAEREAENTGMTLEAWLAFAVAALVKNRDRRNQPQQVRVEPSAENMQRYMDLVQGGMSLRQAMLRMGISSNTLYQTWPRSNLKFSRWLMAARRLRRKQYFPNCYDERGDPVNGRISHRG